jgi:hypothetical protein
MKIRPRAERALKISSDRGAADIRSKPRRDWISDFIRSIANRCYFHPANGRIRIPDPKSIAFVIAASSRETSGRDGEESACERDDETREDC